MTNEEYRKSRGTDQPFQGTDKQVKRRWYEMNKDAIEARRKKGKATKSKRRWAGAGGGLDPEAYAIDDED
jgi:hypothetical protein